MQPGHRSTELSFTWSIGQWQGLVRPYWLDLFAAPDTFDPDFTHQFFNSATRQIKAVTAHGMPHFPRTINRPDIVPARRTQRIRPVIDMIAADWLSNSP